MSTARLRVAITDDEAPARNRIKNLLDDVSEMVPIELVGEAENGHKLLEMLHSHQADVVLLDIRMPEMDGLEASRRITSRLAPDNRPIIIAMTANAMQGDREMCLAAGMDDYIAKPIRVHKLIDALKNAQKRDRK